MEKINFKDAPSTETPLSAFTLNKMQDNIEKSAVIISATEPTTNEKVWLKKGKNMIRNFYIGEVYEEVSGTIDLSPQWARTDFIEVKQDTLYVFSHQIGSRNGRINCFDENKNHLGYINGEAITEPFKVLENTKYIIISAWWADMSADIETWAQLEQNTVATSYEEYIEPTIYCKNENGVFEEFIKKDNLDNYSLAEQRIGTWIDGKPLYKRTINFGLVGSDQIDKNFIVGNDFAKVPIAKLFLEHPISGHTVTLPSVLEKTTAFFEASAFTDSGNLIVEIRRGGAENWNDWMLCGVFKYTKTTD